MLTLIEALVYAFLIVLLGSAYWYLTIPSNLPPGPAGLPLIGSSLDYWNGYTQRIVIKKNIKKYGPIFKFYIANKLIVVLGDYDTIYEGIVKQGDAFAARPTINGGLPEKYQEHGIVRSEGALWKQHRRFALSTLRDLGVGRPILEEKIKEEIECLIEQIKQYSVSGEAFNPQSPITFAVSNVISQLIFGRRFNYDDQEFVHHFTALSRRLTARGIGFLSPFILSKPAFSLLRFLPLYWRFIRETLEFTEFVEREVKRTMETLDPDIDEPDNYIGAFMKAAASGQGESFTADQLSASAFDLFTAGTETTSTTVRWMILLLTRHPEVTQKVYEEIRDNVGVSSLPSYAQRLQLPFTEAVLMETLRFANLVPLGLLRRATEPTNLRGYEIPKGAIIVSFLENVLHNEDIYPEPLRFRPERFIDTDGKVIRDPKLIPFQAGKRICLGEALARMELFFFLVGLISRFKFSFPPDQPTPSLDPVVGIIALPVAYKITAEIRE